MRGCTGLLFISGFDLEKGASREMIEDVLKFKKRLNDAGVKTTDIVDHDFINSIYFFDPNGLRLEVTARVEKPGQLDQMRRDAHDELKKWTARKAELNTTA